MEQTKAVGKGKNVKDMTKGSVYSLIVAFAFPIFLSQLFQQLYNTADTYIVGKFLGDNALGAVASSSNLIFLLVSFFNGTAQGAGVAISKHFGENDTEKVSRAIHTNILLGILSGLLLTVIGYSLTPTILRLMKTAPEILPEAIEYFKFYFLGALVLILYNVCRGIMNALGDSKRPLYYLIVSSLINIGLDCLFVGVFGWGVWSAAFATVLSQGVSVVLCMISLMQKGHIYTVELKKLKLHKDMVKEIVAYGVPSGVQNSVIGLANVIVQTQINSFKEAAQTAFGVHGKIEGFAFLPITSFTMAISTFVSQNLGAKEYERAKKGARFGIVVSVVLAEIIGLIEYTLSPYLVRIFTDTEEIVSLGVRQSRVVALFYGLLAYSHAIAAIMRGAGKAFVPMFVMLAVWCVIRIIYILTVMHYFKYIVLIYWAYPITWAISSAVYAVEYYFTDWLHGFEKRKGETK